MRDRNIRPHPSPARLPIVRVSLLQPIDRLYSSLGLSLDSIIRKEGLLRIADATPSGFYPYRDAMRILARAAELSGIEHMGFVLGRIGGLPSLGEYGSYIASAPTLQAAIGRANEFVGWASPQTELHLRRSGSKMIWRTSNVIGTQDHGQHGYFHTLALLIEVVRRALGPDWIPDELRIGDAVFCHASAQTVFGPGLRHVDGEWALAFPRTALALPMAPWPDVTSPPTPEKLATAVVAAEFSASVEALVRSYLSTGRASEEMLAHSSGLSLRTFQRQLLNGDRQNFRGLVNEIRFKEACTMLSDRNQLVRDIARSLGYSEQANFTRAFVRWTGLTPSEYRETASAGNAEFSRTWADGK